MTDIIKNTTSKKKKLPILLKSNLKKLLFFKVLEKKHMPRFKNQLKSLAFSNTFKSGKFNLTAEVKKKLDLEDLLKINDFWSHFINLPSGSKNFLSSVYDIKRQQNTTPITKFFQTKEYILAIRKLEIEARDIKNYIKKLKKKNKRIPVSIFFSLKKTIIFCEKLKQNLNVYFQQKHKYRLGKFIKKFPRVKGIYRRYIKYYLYNTPQLKQFNKVLKFPNSEYSLKKNWSRKAYKRFKKILTSLPGAKGHSEEANAKLKGKYNPDFYKNINPWVIIRLNRKSGLKMHYRYLTGYRLFREWQFSFQDSYKPKYLGDTINQFRRRPVKTNYWRKEKTKLFAVKMRFNFNSPEICKAEFRKGMRKMLGLRWNGRSFFIPDSAKKRREAFKRIVKAFKKSLYLPRIFYRKKLKKSSFRNIKILIKANNYVSNSNFKKQIQSPTSQQKDVKIKLAKNKLLKSPSNPGDCFNYKLLGFERNWKFFQFGLTYIKNLFKYGLLNKRAREKVKRTLKLKKNYRLVRNNAKIFPGKKKSFLKKRFFFRRLPGTKDPIFKITPKRKILIFFKKLPLKITVSYKYNKVYYLPKHLRFTKRRRPKKLVWVEKIKKRRKLKNLKWKEKIKKKRKLKKLRWKKKIKKRKLKKLRWKEKIKKRKLKKLVQRKKLKKKFFRRGKILLKKQNKVFPVKKKLRRLLLKKKYSYKNLISYIANREVVKKKIKEKKKNTRVKLVMLKKKFKLKKDFIYKSILYSKYFNSFIRHGKKQKAESRFFKVSENLKKTLQHYLHVFYEEVFLKKCPVYIKLIRRGKILYRVPYQALKYRIPINATKLLKKNKNLIKTRSVKILWDREASANLVRKNRMYYHYRWSR